MQYVFCTAATSTVFTTLTGVHLCQWFYWQIWIAYLMIYRQMIWTAFFFQQIQRVWSPERYCNGFCGRRGNNVLVAYPILIKMIGKQEALSMSKSAAIVNIIWCHYGSAWILKSKNESGKVKQGKAFNSTSTRLNPILVAAIACIAANAAN